MEKRGESLREISWARALFRCGDCDGTARKILQEYCHDLRGIYAAHAASILPVEKKAEKQMRFGFGASGFVPQAELRPDK